MGLPVSWLSRFLGSYSGGGATLPVITSIVATPGNTSVVITWTTDVASDSIVQYGLTSSYGSTATNATLTTSHSVTISGLTAATGYHFLVKSSIDSINYRSSSDQTTTTTGFPSSVDFGALSLAGAGKVQIASAGATITSGNGGGEWQLDGSGYLSKVAATTLASASYTLGLSTGGTCTVTRLANTYSVASVTEATTLLDVVDGTPASNGALKKATHTTTASVLFRPGSYDASVNLRTSPATYTHWGVWLARGAETGTITIGCHGDKLATIEVGGSIKALNGAATCVQNITVSGLKLHKTPTSNATATQTSPFDNNSDKSAGIWFYDDTGIITFTNCEIYSDLRNYDSRRYLTDETGLFTLMDWGGGTSNRIVGAFTMTNCIVHGARRLLNVSYDDAVAQVTFSGCEFYDFSNDAVVLSTTRHVDVLDCHFHSPYSYSMTGTYKVQDYSAGATYGVSEWVQSGGLRYVNGKANQTGVAPSATPQASFTGSISGTTLTVSSVASGTIAVGQWITSGNGLGTGSTPPLIISGSGTTWTISRSMTVTSRAMESNSWYNHTSGMQAHRDFMQWVFGDQRSTSSNMAINILRNVVYGQRYDGVEVVNDVQGLPFLADNDPWNFHGVNVRGNTVVLGISAHGSTIYNATGSTIENNTIVGTPTSASDGSNTIITAGLTAALTGASWSAGSTTYTYNYGTLAAQFLAGDKVTVSGCTPSGYNGTDLVIASATAGSFTVTMADPGLLTVTGSFISSLTSILGANTIRNNVSGNGVGTNPYESVTAAESSQALIAARYAAIFTGPTWEGFGTKADLLAAYTPKTGGPLATSVPRIGADPLFVNYTAKTITDWVYSTPTIGAFANGNYTNATASTLYQSGDAPISAGTAGQFVGIDYSVSPAGAEYSIDGGVTWRKDSYVMAGSTGNVRVRWTTGATLDGATYTVRVKVGTTTKDWTVKMIIPSIMSIVDSYGGVYYDFNPDPIDSALVGVYSDNKVTTAAVTNPIQVAANLAATGSAYDLTQATLGNRPILRQNANSQYYAEFTGASSQFMSAASHILSTAAFSSTVTISIATPGVVSWTAHGLTNGTAVAIGTTGALPTGLTASTINVTTAPTLYYVVNATTDTFELAATPGGSSIATSGTQSGVHTVYSSAPCTIFVAGFVTGTSAQTLLSYRAGTAAYTQMEITTGPVMRFLHRNSTSDPSDVGTVAANTDFVAAGVRTKGTFRKTAYFKTGGASPFEWAPDSSPAVGLITSGGVTATNRLGCGFTSANTAFMTGGIYAMVVLPGEASDADITSIKNWMVARYNP